MAAKDNCTAYSSCYQVLRWEQPSANWWQEKCERKQRKRRSHPEMLPRGWGNLKMKLSDISGPRYIWPQVKLKNIIQNVIPRTFTRISRNTKFWLKSGKCKYDKNKER
jgi:hypothetical protein